MINKLLTISILLLLFVIITAVPAVAAKKKSELMTFISSTPWEDVSNSGYKEEDFQILLRLATNDDIKELQKIATSKFVKESQKILAIKALGSLKNTDSQPLIRQTLLHDKNKNIVYICTWALIELGGYSNYQFIIDNFPQIEKVINNKEMLYSILISLSEKFKNNYVLRYITSFINTDQQNLYKPIFLFTVYGRTPESEQVLLDLLNSDNKNVRLNSAEILGKWYASPGAVKTFENRLKVETDPEIRKILITGLGTIGTKASIDELEVLSKNAPNNADKTIASESLKTIDKIKEEIKKDKEFNYKPNDQVFKQELSKLMSSRGNDGSYKILRKNADYQDIPSLEKLKETIMVKTTNDAMINYNKVTKIIIRLRLANESMKIM